VPQFVGCRTRRSAFIQVYHFLMQTRAQNLMGSECILSIFNIDACIVRSLLNLFVLGLHMDVKVIVE
jgi:hypothetical protein